MRNDSANLRQVYFERCSGFEPLLARDYSTGTNLVDPQDTPILKFPYFARKGLIEQTFFQISRRTHKLMQATVNSSCLLRVSSVVQLCDKRCVLFHRMRVSIASGKRAVVNVIIKPVSGQQATTLNLAYQAVRFRSAREMPAKQATRVLPITEPFIFR